MATLPSSPSSFARRLAIRAGMALVFVTIAACNNSDKRATPEPDRTKIAPENKSPGDEAAQIKALLDKAAEADRAEEKAKSEKAAAEKAAAEKAAADKAAEEKAAADKAKEATAKPAGTDKAGDKPKKDAVASKAVSPKSTKIESKTGILAKGQADKFAKAGGKSVVRLLEPGAEPRAVASYAIALGPSKPLQIGMDLEMTMKSGELQVPTTAMPRMNLLFNFDVGARAAAEWPITGKLSKISVEARTATQEQIASALRPHLGQLEGIGMNYFVDEKGRIRDVKVTLPPTLPEMAGQLMSGMTQSVESMTSALPTEPIGIGAQWEVFSRIVANGADILQVSTFTLEKREGTVLTLDAVVRQFAAKESVKPPGLPPTASARILAFKCRGTGKPVFDLADVAPKSGSMSIDSAMTIELEAEVEGTVEKQSTTIDTKTTASYTRPAP